MTTPIISESFISFSISGSSVQSSDESAIIEKIQSKSKKLKELLEGRLETFLKVSNKCCENDFFVNSSKEDYQGSLNQTIIQGEENKEEVNPKALLEEISSLQKQMKSLKLQLLEVKSDIQETEAEESELKQKAFKVESSLNRFLLESKEENQANCRCLLM
jgi:hypothetical protein